MEVRDAARPPVELPRDLYEQLLAAKNEADVQQTERHRETVQAQRETMRWAFLFAMLLLLVLTGAIIAGQADLAKILLSAMISFLAGFAGGRMGSAAGQLGAK